jgi:hypothetical protein
MSEKIKQESLSLETSESISESTSVSESTSTSTSISDSVSSSESVEEPIVESEVQEELTTEEAQDGSTKETEEKISVILKDGTDISDVAFMNGIFLLVPYEKRKKASEYYSGITINGTTYDEVVAFKVTLEKQGDYYAINYHLDDEEEEE